jgi:hypothetical protein
MDIELYKIALGVLVGILSSAIGVIGYFIKDTRAKMDMTIKENEKKVETVKDEFATFKAVLPKEFVMRDDFIRSQAALDNKIDIIGRDILDIKENIGKLFGGGEGQC